MGRGVFRIGVAPVGHGRESPHTLAPHRIKEIPLSYGHACQCAALPMMRDASVQRDSVALLYG
jgi:hypothetical protein